MEKFEKEITHCSTNIKTLPIEIVFSILTSFFELIYLGYKSISDERNKQDFAKVSRS